MPNIFKEAEERKRREKECPRRDSSCSNASSASSSGSASGIKQPTKQSLLERNLHSSNVRDMLPSISTKANSIARISEKCT